MYLNETYGKVGVCEYLSDTVRVQNGTPPKTPFIAVEF
jgi:hypothetical protein